MKKGTIFEDSPLGLDKWLPAIWLIANTRNGTSSHELGRALGVTQQTAWFMLHRIQEAMKTGIFAKLKDTVEVDETLWAARSATCTRRCASARSWARDVRAYVFSDRTHATVRAEIAKNVDPGAKVYTDSFTSYNCLRNRYWHGFADYNAIEFVRGEVRTNGIENFRTLFKRCLKETYISVLPCHLDAYLVEGSFCFNERKLRDGERFRQVVGQINGKQITYRALVARGR